MPKSALLHRLRRWVLLGSLTASWSMGTGLIGIEAESGFGPISFASGQEIDFSETFALAEDRQAVLQQLVPGTEEAYFYTALMLQQGGQLDRVPPLLEQWQLRHGTTARWTRIAHRQALLNYPQDHAAALEYLRRTFDLRFDHQRIPESDRPDLPIQLDPAQIAWQAFRDRAFAGNSVTDSVAESGLYRLLSQPFDSPARLRSALSRVTVPDHPQLAELVIRDLQVPDHGAFGDLNVHRLLTREQLDRCLELEPRLLENAVFVHTYLTRLWVGPDVDPTRDDAAYEAYLDRLWAFVAPLSPIFNSLKAHVLYHRLQFDRVRGIYDKERFMAYLQLPRQVGYMRPEYLTDAQRAGYPADLQQDFSAATRLPIVHDDEPLVRHYLDFFLLDADGIEEFSPFVRGDYLRRRLAEVKILAGIGDPERWASFLGPAEFQAIKERIDLEFAPTNPRHYGPLDPVVLELDIKNIETLIVKVFEIHARNWYEQQGTEINTDIPLDGLVANHERVVHYEAAPLRRHRRQFEFPEIERPGVYVIDFIGNGRSSRVLIRKGRLHHSVRSGHAGQIITVYDDVDQPAVGAIVRLGGRDYVANDAGEVTIPYSTSPGRVPMILQHGPLATLERFDHEAEQYALQAGIHVDRESLLRSRAATILIRPQLTLGGLALPIGLLEETTLTIVSTDLDGISTTKTIKPFELFDDREAETTIQVPPRLVTLSVSLQGKIHNLSLGSDQTLSTSHQVSINGIDTQAAVDEPLQQGIPHADFNRRSRNLCWRRQNRLRLQQLPERRLECFQSQIDALHIRRFLGLFQSDPLCRNLFTHCVPAKVLEFAEQ